MKPSRKNENFIFNFLVLSILAYSFYLSFVYSTYHIDPWHWGTITSEATDYLNGFKLFKDITLMYGPGMPILFKFINYIYPINYFTIGIITSLFYILNLFVCYLILLKLSDKIIATILLFILFILNPYPQVPWSDYFAGTCLTLFIYFLIDSKGNNLKLYLSGFFLFLCIVFRNTYLVSILPSILLFILLIFFTSNKIDLKILKIICSFIFFLISFLFILFITQNLQLWFEQGIGRSKDYFQYDYSLFYNPLTKFIYHLLIPKSLGNFIFLIFYIINFIFLNFLLFSKKNFDEKINKEYLLILCSFGLFGILQSFDQFEIWRNLNSSICIFIVTALILNYLKIRFIGYLNYFGVFIFLFGIIFMTPNPIFSTKYPSLIFPTFGHLDYKDFREIKNDPTKVYWKWKKYSKNNFKIIDINFFSSHRFSEENIIYYKNMKNLICNYNKIINFTMDRTLAYICDKKNQIVSTFSDRYPPIFFNKEIQNKIENGDIDNQTIILADKNFKNNGLKLLQIQNIPLYTRFSSGALYRKFFSNEIYIYVK